MNKNLFKTFAIAAMAVLAGACAKEQVGSADGETVEMTFNVDVPETTITTKGLSDAAQVDELKFQLFIKDGDGYKMVQEQIVPVADKKAVVKAILVKKQTYSAAFWAQASGNDFYETTDLRAVKMNIANVKANEPTMDAFWGNDLVIKPASGMKPRTIKMLRALAQVNFGTVIPTGADALSITKSQVVMKGVPTTLNVLLGNKDNSHSGSEDITFQDNAPISGEKLIIADGETQYDYVATAYVFAPISGKLLTDVSAKVTFNNGNYTTISAPNVPIRRNFRTNILGNLLSVDGEWNISIDEKFTGDITYDEIEGKLLAGKNVTLTTDYSVAKNSKGVVAKSVDNTFAVLDLNGHKFENSNSVMDNKAALQVHGNLRIVGDGKVLCNGGGDNNAVIVENGAHLIIEGGYYYVNKDKNDKSNATVFISPNGYPGKKSLVEIKGGTFEAEVGTNGTPFVLNQDDAVKEICFKVYGGTFIGFNPADNNADGEHTNYVAEGYKSVKISESPATWQVVDASKTISDQTGLNSALGEASTGDYLKLPVGTYTLPALTKSVEGVTFEGKLGEDGNPLTVIDLASVSYLPSGSSYNYNNVTFKNIQFKTWPKEAKYKGFQHSGNLLFEGCTFTGIHFSYGNETYKKCKFIQEEEEYNMWVYGGTIVDYIDCTFEGKGKLLHVYNEGNPHITVNIQGCKFISTVSDKPAINIKGTCGEKALDYTVNIDNCTVSGAFPEINGGLWQVDKPATAEKNKITVNVKGEKVY